MQDFNIGILLLDQNPAEVTPLITAVNFGFGFAYFAFDSSSLLSLACLAAFDLDCAGAAKLLSC